MIVRAVSRIRMSNCGSRAITAPKPMRGQLLVIEQGLQSLLSHGVAPDSDQFDRTGVFLADRGYQSGTEKVTGSFPGDKR